MYIHIRVSVRRTETCCGVTLSMCFRRVAWTSSGLSLVYHRTRSIDGIWLISKSSQPSPSGIYTNQCCICTQLKASFSIWCSGELVNCTGQSWKIVLCRSNFVTVHPPYCHIKTPCECIWYICTTYFVLNLDTNKLQNAIQRHRVWFPSLNFWIVQGNSTEVLEDI